MTAPMEGIRVLEVANWLAAPSATALMADLGADVIKVEPPEGDMYRGFVLQSMGYDYEFPTNYAFETDNRGKRSVTIDLEKPGGAELVRRMAKECDVFVTNLIRHRAERYGLTYEEVCADNPNVIYTAFSGYGTRGPDADRAGFDFAAFWARSGAMGLLAEPDAPPPLCRGGQGDHSTTTNILSAVLAALLLRERTGEGQYVECTLQASGMWTLAGDYSAALNAGQHPPRISRKSPVNPIWNSYQCADGDWVLLVNAVPFPRYWPAFCRTIGKPEWAEEYGDLATLRAHSAELTAQLDAIFAEHDRAWWSQKLDEAGVIWAPVARLTDALEDPQVAEMGWIATVEHPEHGPYKTLDTPFKIYGSEVGVKGPAPSPGQHTFDVLAEFGIEGDELSELAVNGVIG